MKIPTAANGVVSDMSVGIKGTDGSLCSESSYDSDISKFTGQPVNKENANRTKPDAHSTIGEIAPQGAWYQPSEQTNLPTAAELRGIVYECWDFLSLKRENYATAEL